MDTPWKIIRIVQLPSSLGKFDQSVPQLWISNNRRHIGRMYTRIRPKHDVVSMLKATLQSLDP